MKAPKTSRYARPTTMFSGGGGLVSTAGDYLRFCRMLLGGGTLDGTRILGRKTLELMTRNHLPDGQDLLDASVGLFAETPYDGTGFGLGFSVNLDPVAGGAIGSVGEYAWGGMASTFFWVDPTTDICCVFLTQLTPSSSYSNRAELKALVHGAIA